jgi:hypothetical protein
MGLLEWVLEPMNPGPTGTIETGTGRQAPPAPPVIWLRFVVTITILAAVIVLTIYYVVPYLFCSGWFLLLLLGAYLLAGLLLNPKPDMTNIGWAGGIIDNPLRYSDDINRSLLMLKIILFPGRFFSLSILWWIKLMVMNIKNRK